jgi:hypothetical protein
MTSDKSMFTLNQVVPWGRTFDEYRRMFALTDSDLELTIVGCGDGPASFNCEATRRGVRIVSCDPIYAFDRSEINERIAATYDQILEQTRRNANEFVWDEIRSPEELGRIRMAAMQAFLDDYDSGKNACRYVDRELPNLGFSDDQFDLALCSHLVFLYSSQLGESFHRAAVTEMCRIAKEVRIFPLLSLGGERSPFVDVCAHDMTARGFDGGTQMMRISRQARSDHP